MKLFAWLTIREEVRALSKSEWTPLVRHARRTMRRCATRQSDRPGSLVRRVRPRHLRPRAGKPSVTDVRLPNQKNKSGASSSSRQRLETTLSGWPRNTRQSAPGRECGLGHRGAAHRSIRAVIGALVLAMLSKIGLRVRKASARPARAPTSS